MEMLLFALGVLACIAVNCLTAYILGYIQTETKGRIPLNFRPFTCRPCFTFWLAVLLASVLAVAVAPFVVGHGWAGYWAAFYGLFGLGGFAALALFFYVKSKYIIQK